MQGEFRPVRSSETRQDLGDPKAPFGTYGLNGVQKALVRIARGSVLHRGRLRHRMTNLIARIGGDRPMDVSFRGCNYRIEGRNNLIEYGLLLHPGYNGEEIDFLSAGLREGGVALDIGCNIGLYSLPLGHAVGGSGRVISIDANPMMIEKLRWNAAASGLDQITAIHTAVGDIAGRVDLEIRKDDVAIVGVRESDDGAFEIAPLADILARVGTQRVDVLKIDIEGHEDKALVPYLDAASDAMLPDRIVIEHPSGTEDYQGCAAAFDRHGYRRVGMTRSNSLYLRGGQ